MKKMLTFLVMLIFATSWVFAGWNFSETIFDFSAADSALVGGTGSMSGDFFASNSPHGVVVDSEGKIWVAMHSGYGPDQDGDPEFWGRNMADPDSVFLDTCHYKPLYCFNSDGTPASFSPITSLVFPDQSIDTLYSESTANGSGKGITVDQDGNIIYTAYSTIYRINSQTGEGMNKYVPEDMGSLTEAVQDPNSGLVYHAWVIGGTRPVVILDEDFEFVGNALDTLGYITRSIAVKSETSGETDIYVGTTWSGWGVPHYYSDASPTDPIGYSGFEIVDTLGRWEYYDAEDDTTVIDPLWSSSLDFNTDATKLLVGCLRSSWGGVYGSRWYTIDLASGLADTIGVAAPDSAAANPDIYVAGGANGPRGGYFVDENTLYTADFYMWTIDKWTYTSAVEDENQVARTFKLEQNYPNPFNPSTTIPFVLDREQAITLKVYNLTGQEIATIIDNQLMLNGSHKVQFNASNLPTGMYIYQLNAGNKIQTKKMMFIK